MAEEQHPSGPEGAARIVEKLQDARASVGEWVEQKGWERDEARIDLNAARRLVRDGVSTDRVQTALAELPEVKQREADPQAYGERVGRLATDIEHLQWHKHQAMDYADRQGWEPKPQRAEFRATVKLLDEGASREDARAALTEIAWGKGAERDAYVERTVDRAAERLHTPPDRERATPQPEAEPALTANRGRGGADRDAPTV